jgi:hypothetical protein
LQRVLGQPSEHGVAQKFKAVALEYEQAGLDGEVQSVLSSIFFDVAQGPIWLRPSHERGNDKQKNDGKMAFCVH